VEREGASINDFLGKRVRHLEYMLCVYQISETIKVAVSATGSGRGISTDAANESLPLVNCLAFSVKRDFVGWTTSKTSPTFKRDFLDVHAWVNRSGRTLRVFALMRSPT